MAPEITEKRKKKSTKATAKDVKSDLSQHKKDLEKLKDEDPEFYEFLKNNDKSLLEFAENLEDFPSDDSDNEDKKADIDGESDSDASVMDFDEEADNDEDVSEEGENDDEEVKDDNSEAEEEEKPKGPVLTEKLVANWISAMKEKHSISCAKKFISALAAVAKITAEDEKDVYNLKYSVESEAVYGQLILGAVQAVPLVFHHHILAKVPKTQLPSSSPQWQKNRPLVKSWLSNLLSCIDQLTDLAMLDFVLRQILAENVVIYYACFGENSLGRKFVKKILDIWSSCSSLVSEDDSEIIMNQKKAEDRAKRMKQIRSMKLGAFVVVRQLAFHSPSTFMEHCLKYAYRSFLSVCSNTNSNTLAHLKFLQECLVELFKLDPIYAYQHAFVSIRQLAVKLRDSITQMKDVASKRLFNWQTVHSIGFWCTAIPKLIDEFEINGREHMFDQLIYPLTQVSLGIIRHAQGSHFYPLHYHIARGLCHLSAACTVYIPICAPIMQTLSHMHSMKRQKPASLKPLDWSLHYRTPTGYLSTQVYMDDCVDKMFGLLVEIMTVWSTSIAFPEIALAPIVHLKKMSKESKNPKFVKWAKAVVKSLEETRVEVMNRRVKVEFAPCDSDRVLEFAKSVKVNDTAIGKYMETLGKVSTIVKSQQKSQQSQGKKGKYNKRKPGSNKRKL